MTFTVLTWNIHKGIGGVDRRYRPERVVEVLARYRPDFALLQEVDEGARRSRYHRQIDLLGDALGMIHRCYGPTHRLLTYGHYGNAILSRWPLFQEHQLDLTIGTRKRRGAIYARARIRFGRKAQTVALYNLHLGLAGSERALQLRRFLRTDPFYRLHHRTPIVLGGDFNDLWGTLGARILLPAGFRRAGRRWNTFPAFMPVRPLDGIFLRGDVRARHCFPSKLGAAREASDHLPLVAELEITRGSLADLERTGERLAHTERRRRFSLALESG